MQQQFAVLTARPACTLAGSTTNTAMRPAHRRSGAGFGWLPVATEAHRSEDPTIRSPFVADVDRVSGVTGTHTAVSPSGTTIIIDGSAGLPVTPPSPDGLLRELINEHSGSMFRVAKSIVREDALAEDVVQESIIKAWQAADSFRGDSSLKSWALRITHNTAISTLRRRREEYRDPARLPEAPTSHGTERDVHGRMMVTELWAALDLLDPTSRTITVLREVEGMSYDDIAEALELPLPTVKTRLFRARKILANELHEWR